MGAAGTGVRPCDLQHGELDSILAHLLLPELVQGLLAPGTLLSSQGCLQTQAHTAVTCTEGKRVSGRQAADHPLATVLTVQGVDTRHTQGTAAAVQRCRTASTAFANNRSTKPVTLQVKVNSYQAAAGQVPWCVHCQRVPVTVI